MAKNYVQHGDVLSFTAPTGGVVSGNGYLIGTVFVVALHSAAEGEKSEGRRTGVWTLPKASAQAWTEGAAIYWDNTNEVATTTATSNTKIGAAAAVAANPSSEGQVLLNVT